MTARVTKSREYDVHQTAEILGHSVSWLYHNAGKTIPVIKRGRRLRWTDDLIEQIIRDSVCQPVAKPAQDEPAQAKPEPKSKRKPSKSGASSASSDIPQARPERARRLRQMEGAA